MNEEDLKLMIELKLIYKEGNKFFSNVYMCEDITIKINKLME